MTLHPDMVCIRLDAATEVLTKGSFGSDEGFGSKIISSLAALSICQDQHLTPPSIKGDILSSILTVPGGQSAMAS
jgi:hypothetical protein